MISSGDWRYVVTHAFSLKSLVALVFGSARKEYIRRP